MKYLVMIVLLAIAGCRKPAVNPGTDQIRPGWQIEIYQYGVTHIECAVFLVHGSGQFKWLRVEDNHGDQPYTYGIGNIVVRHIDDVYKCKERVIKAEKPPYPIPEFQE